MSGVTGEEVERLSVMTMSYDIHVRQNCISIPYICIVDAIVRLAFQTF